MKKNTNKGTPMHPNEEGRGRMQPTDNPSTRPNSILPRSEKHVRDLFSYKLWMSRIDTVIPWLLAAAVIILGFSLLTGRSTNFGIPGFISKVGAALHPFGAEQVKGVSDLVYKEAPGNLQTDPEIVKTR